MISLKLLQSAIKDLKNITQADYALYDGQGKVVAGTFEKGAVKEIAVAGFIESEALSQEIGGNNFFRIEKDEDVYALVVNARGGDGHLYGRIAVSEITHFMNAGNERLEREEFYRDVLTERIIPSAIGGSAGKLKISMSGNRVVYYIETEEEFALTTRELLLNLFSEDRQDYVTAMDDGIVLIKYLPEDYDPDYLDDISMMIISSVNTELMIPVKVTYSNVIQRLEQLPDGYRQARMAMDIVKIFFEERASASYSSLGIGRIIYELPDELCDSFLSEVFGHEKAGLDPDEEKLAEEFLDNSLSIADTCRKLNIPRSTLVYRIEKLAKKTGLDIRIFEDAMTLKLALMVSRFREVKA